MEKKYIQTYNNACFYDSGLTFINLYDVYGDKILSKPIYDDNNNVLIRGQDAIKFININKKLRPLYIWIYDFDKRYTSTTLSLLNRNRGVICTFPYFGNRNNKSIFNFLNNLEIFINKEHPIMVDIEWCKFHTQIIYNVPDCCVIL